MLSLWTYVPGADEEVQMQILNNVIQNFELLTCREIMFEQGLNEDGICRRDE